MASEPDPKISNREIFRRALEINDLDLRRQYLEKACESDSARRSHIEKLLAAHASEQTNALDRAILHLEPNETRLVTPPVKGRSEAFDVPRMDRFKIREQIGEGGMGIVYVAEQMSPVRRKVALKIIKPGMGSKDIVARFESERQALALMDHPNIAKVLDGATLEDGRPYFVMELVQGVSITEFCDSGRLSNRERLQLFVEVCGAVQHAHQKGIIHRDLKPSNILVTMNDDKSMPKVIDFGIAKAISQPLTENSIYTAYGQMLGTPLYMSPEQAQFSSLDVDTRSDVYSLGVLLYELLTGSLPFDKATLQRSGFDEMRRLIREVDPLRPSQRVSTLKAEESTTVASRRRVDPRVLTRSLADELDWIVMKALEKKRDRRYESASAFADDIKRYLNNEQVQACPPSPWYRLSKLARRYRGPLVSSLIVVAILLVASVTSLWQAIRATRAEKMATAGSALARQAVDDMYTEFAEQWIEENDGLNEMQRQFLQKAMHFYEEFSKNNTDDFQLKIERLRAIERVGAVQGKLGQHQDAEETNKRLIAECTNLIAAHPASSELTLALASARLQLGTLQSKTGRSKEGKLTYEQAFQDSKPLMTAKVKDLSLRKKMAELFQKLASRLIVVGLKENAEECVHVCKALWQSLVDEIPDSWDYRFGLANALRAQGLERMWWGEHKSEAESVYNSAIEEFVMLLNERPRDRKCRDALSGAYLNLGVLKSWNGNLQDALNCLEKARPIAESLVQDYPMDQKSLENMRVLQFNMESYLMNVDNGKRIDEAHEYRRQYLETTKRLCDLYPGVTEYQHNYLQAVCDVLVLLRHENRIATAKAISEECLHWSKALSVPSEWNRESYNLLSRLRQFHSITAMLRLEEGNYSEAALLISSIPEKARLAIPEMMVDEEFEGWRKKYRLLKNCFFGILSLRRPAEVMKQCALLAEQDNSLGLAERSKKVESYLERAREFENECSKISVMWKENLQGLSQAQLKEVFTELYYEDYEGWGFPFENRLMQSTTAANCLDLIREIARQPNASDGLLVGYLVAGVEEIRDADLALKLAKNGLEKEPEKGIAKQDYAWALFRNGRFQECYDILKHNVAPDATAGAVIAMSLWQLGRHDEAKLWLDERYEKELAGYIERRKADQNTVWPTADMLQRLDREAREMLGMASNQ